MACSRATEARRAAAWKCLQCCRKGDVSPLGKVSPITFNKGRAMSENLNEREITQLRGLLISSMARHHTCSALHPCCQARSTRPPFRPFMSATAFSSSAKRTKMSGSRTTRFGSGPDGNSQGGYVIMLVNLPDVLRGGPVPCFGLAQLSYATGGAKLVRSRGTSQRPSVRCHRVRTSLLGTPASSSTTPS